MGIRVSERSEVFHVPYGPPNNEGTPDATFVDLTSHPEWIPVLTPCVGWPETRGLLAAVNAPDSPLMSLAADQGFTAVADRVRPAVLTSFVTLCYADVTRNSKPALQHLATRLTARLGERLQMASDAMQRRLFLDLLVEVQPTVFRLSRAPGSEWTGTRPREVSGLGLQNGGLGSEHAGWSLTVMVAAHGHHGGESRNIWGHALTALQEALGEQTWRG